MSDAFVIAKKFHDLADYLEKINADVDALCQQAQLNLPAILTSAPSANIPALQYSKLYLCAVEWMEQIHSAVPWAAGMGTRPFKLMCQCMIASKTLQDALEKGAEYCTITSPLFGHQLHLQSTDSSDSISLQYGFVNEKAQAIFSPQSWSRADHFNSACHSSGLRTWNSITGWLIGKPLEIEKVLLAAPSIGVDYEMMLNQTFNAPIFFDQDCSALIIPKTELELPIVQDSDSLLQFLNYVLYHFWVSDQSRLATTNAIKSMIGNLESSELPSFVDIASRLHMSSSTLRRRLIQEDTSYQQIKDECRKNSAIELLTENRIKVDDIANRLGFAETSSFIRAFKKWTGMTPRAFRENTRSYAKSKW